MKQRILKFGSALIIAAIAIAGCTDSSGSENKMEKLSELVNKNVPFKVDDVTTLTGTSVPAPNTLQYEYNVEEITKADLDETKLPGIIESMKPGMIENAKTNKEMELLRELNTNLIYVYKDVNGDELYRIEIKGDEY